MAFTELEIKDYYNTDQDYIPKDFYGLVLPHTDLYKRAAGFFSSSAFVVLGRGLKAFYLHGGTMQLLVSPLFSKEDYDAIELGYRAQEDIEAQKILEMFDIENIQEDEGTNILAWLLYEKRLEIRVVSRKDKSDRAIFHDKFSVLIDEEKNRISYRGSMNESETALVDNYESIEVDCSWKPDGYKRTVQRESQFDEIWNSNARKWATKTIPQAVIEKIIKIRKPNRPGESNSITAEGRHLGKSADPSIMSLPTPKRPDWIEERQYQKEAIAAWLKNKACGIFQMATGTGKTKTSLMAITRVLDLYYAKNAKCGLILVVPYVVLLEQWLDDLKDFSISAIACYESKNKWFDILKTSIDLFNQSIRDRFFVITTNRTFSSKEFQECINSINGAYIFCVDEMHHLTSDTMLSQLPQNAMYRLGLSATLMTKYSSEKMDLLKAYFGDVVYEYSMERAIKEKKLTKYYYYPIYIDLTDEEKAEYYEISRKISKAVAISGGEIDDEDNTNLQALLSQRARIVSSAENKLLKLREIAGSFKDKTNMIVYCGDKIEADQKYIDKVYDIVNNEIGIISARFTAGENKKQREDILSMFRQRTIQALIAIRCLDEGVDIPQLETAIIMSSGTNPKEFIQRRGRILRPDPNNKNKIAVLYDFIVVPTLSLTDIDTLTLEERQMEMKIISREYERVEEFANLAINGLEVKNEFLNIWSKYVGGNVDNA